MSHKRQPDEGNTPEEKRQKVPALRDVILEVMKKHRFQKFLSGIEPLLRKVVKEEVEVAVKKHFGKKQNCGKQIHPSTSKNLLLHFRNKLSLPIFTGSKIEGAEGSAIEVALVDALTGKVISSGPESSAKVEIVVLEGDFEGGSDDVWSVEEFNNNIVKERGGKRPLLSGESVLYLKEGTSMLSELLFTDNSSWTRSRKFRLGARVVGGTLDGIRVKEAKSEAFMVKDHRGELYKKHHPPSLIDDVWRLEKIGKDGAFHKRLSIENINTVKDFLTLLSLDPLRLRNILGTGMSAKMWEVTVEHAQTCGLSDQMYVYYPSSNVHNMGVVFNVVRKALGVLSEGRIIPFDELLETEKVNAHKWVKFAYEHWEEVVHPYDAGSTGDDSSHVPGVCFTSSSTAAGNSYANQIPNFHDSDEFGFAPRSSPSYIASSTLPLEGTRSLDDIPLQGYSDINARYDHLSGFTPQLANTFDCDTEAMIQSFSIGDHMQYFDSDSFQPQNFCPRSDADLQTAVKDFIAMPAQSTAAATSDKAHTRWAVLYRVLKWRYSIKRIMASKKSGGRKM